MRKSGLHKQIASIFEGAPMTDTAAADPQAAAPASVPAAPSRGFHPDRVAPRPVPAPKAAASPEPSLAKKSGVSSAKKKSNVMDDAARRQKKMTLLVGILSVVFVGVMIFSFGGVGQTDKAPASKTETVSASVPVSQYNPESWVFPEPLPAQMRDPLVIPKPQLLLSSHSQDDPTAVVVRGIVHSETLPSAIVGDQVVLEGQTIQGITVVKITRDAVEFEKDGKRWIQHVQ